MIEVLIYLLFLLSPINHQDDGIIKVAMVDTSTNVLAVCEDCVTQQHFIFGQMQAKDHAYLVSSVIQRYCTDCDITLYGAYMPLPYFSDVGQVIALYRACLSDADIINYSMAVPRRVRIMSAVVKYCLDNNKVIVAASGNNPDNRPYYPCAYEGVICIGSLDTYQYTLTASPWTTNNGHVDFYHAGAYKIDDIVHYGTSFSVAASSGRIYKIWSRQQYLTNIELKSYLIKNMIEVDSQVRIIFD